MDFQPTEDITETQAIGDNNGNPNSTAPQMAGPLSPEHTVLHTDIEIITSSVLEQFTQTIFTGSLNSLPRTTPPFKITPTASPNKSPRLAPGSPRCMSNSSWPDGDWPPLQSRLVDRAIPTPAQRKRGGGRRREPQTKTPTPTALPPTLDPIHAHTPTLLEYHLSSHTHQQSKPHIPPTLKVGRTCGRRVRERRPPHPNSSRPCTLKLNLRSHQQKI